MLDIGNSLQKGLFTFRYRYRIILNIATPKYGGEDEFSTTAKYCKEEVPTTIKY